MLNHGAGEPHTILIDSVSNRSKPLELFRVRVGNATEQLQLVLPHEKPGPLLLGRVPPENRVLASPAFALQSSILVLIVSQDDLYVNDAALGDVLPAGLQFFNVSNISCVAIANQQFGCDCECYLIVTQRILIGVQIGTQGLKDHQNLGLLRIELIMIR